MECLNHLLQGLLFSKYQGHLLIVTSTLTLAIAMPFENVFFFFYEGLSRWLSGKESTCQCRRRRFDPWEGKILCRRKWQPTPVFLPGKSYRQTSWWAGVARVRHDWAIKQQQTLTGHSKLKGEKKITNKFYQKSIAIKLLISFLVLCFWTF